MSRLRVAALAALVAAAALLVLAAQRGQLRVGLLLFIPFLVGQGVLAFAGAALLMLALVLWFLGTPMRPLAPPGAEWAERGPAPERETRHGGVVLLGPIPIVWGSGRALPWMVAAGVLLLALALALTLATR